MKIGYKIFGQNSLNYGLSYCIYKNHIKAEMVTENTAQCYDVILFSVFWWQHIIDFVDFCNKARIGKHKNEKPYIIVGGFNSFNPVIFKKYAHCVVVGDGEDVLQKAINKEYHPSFYTGIEKEVIYNQADISKNSFIYSNEAKIARVEIARGCPYHCKFCQLSGLKKYREVGIETIKKCLLLIKDRRVSLFAPNKTSHSDFDKIKLALQSTGKTDLTPDVRFNDVERFYSKSIQIGIEGISERLRFSVGKKMTNERFREIISYIIEKGIAEGGKPFLHCGYIIDLPGEQDVDWKEFNDFMDGLQDIKNIDKFNMFFIFNMFMPSPFTQYENETIHFDREYQPKIKDVFKKNRKFKVAIHGRLFGNYSRILSMICTRGGEAVPDILNDIDVSIKKDIPDNKKILPLIFIMKKYGGIEKYTGIPSEKPWKMVKIG